MNSLLIFIFLVLFGIVLAAVSLGFKVLEDQKKRRVSGMLRTDDEGNPIQPGPSVLSSQDESSRSSEIFDGLKISNDVESAIRQAGVNWTVGGLLFASVAAGILGSVIGYVLPILVFHWFTMLVFGVGFASLPWVILSRKRAKRLKEFEEQFPEALDFLSRSMRAGHAFSISLEMLGEEAADPLGQEFRALFHELNLGGQIDDALANLSARVPLVDVRFFVSAVLLQRQTGGNMSEILTRLAYVIRERFRVKGQVRAASAHGRLTAVILSVMPIATMAALMFVAPTYLPTLAKDPDGKWMIVAALIGQGLGYFTMRRIVNIKV